MNLFRVSLAVVLLAAPTLGCDAGGQSKAARAVAVRKLQEKREGCVYIYKRDHLRNRWIVKEMVCNEPKALDNPKAIDSDSEPP